MVHCINMRYAIPRTRLDSTLWQHVHLNRWRYVSSKESMYEKIKKGRIPLTLARTEKFMNMAVRVPCVMRNLQCAVCSALVVVAVVYCCLSRFYVWRHY